tara:strand:+ start:1121 stop:1981 length:861 start_codon:yes stop_codon:yes gene_type:complete
MKGIILAGGKGSRLYPSTIAVSKQLLPIYDKPMIYYSLSILMLSDVKDILLICAPDQKKLYESLLGSGSQFGLNISYMLQEEPRGIAEAFLIGEDFIGNDTVCLTLGDNILWGQGLSGNLLRNKKTKKGASIFGYSVPDPENYGVIKVNKNEEPVDIIEKPKKFVSNYAIPGIYFYDNSVCEKAKSLKPSRRGELEITDINKLYLKEKKLNVKFLGRGFAWLDTGSPELMLEASHFVRTIEKRQGTKIACLEEIALKKSWITKQNFKNRLKKLTNGSYKEYLERII